MILGKLNSGDLAACESVCRRWNGIIQDIRQCKQSLFIDYIHQLDQPMEFNEHIFPILKKYPKLKELGIARSYYVDEVTVEIIGQCCPELEKISIINGFTAAGKDIPAFCLGLKFPRLLISSEALSLVWESFPNLQTLELHYVDEGKLSFLVCYNQRIHLFTKNLQISSSDILSQVFKIVPRFGKLESLYIEPYNRIDDEGFIKFIDSCRNLKDLCLPRSFSLSDEGISKLADFCKNLKCLNISGSDISDLGIASLSRLNFLEKLCLAETGVTDGGLKGILTGCSNLHSLNVDHCRAVTVAILLTAYDLKTRGLLNPQLVIKYREELIKMSSMRNQQEIHDLNQKLKYQSKREDHNDSSNHSEESDSNVFDDDDLDNLHDEDDSDGFYDEDDFHEFFDGMDLDDPGDEHDYGRSN
ncbi:uncharacterized protein LOC141850202 [Brevipalpus obovatus]|uniref:uncharacterized protein LOC141850202 n=1 Tax=Brevipalpus obovatus TaxID=246614 RepID=UPI003D9E403B